MFIVNMANPINLLLILAMVILLIFLAKELKKSLILQILLGVFLALLIMHTVLVLGLDEATIQFRTLLFRCITIDFIFIFIVFFSYLWVDDIECKYKNKKSVDNSLDWFWKKV